MVKKQQSLDFFFVIWIPRNVTLMVSDIKQFHTQPYPDTLRVPFVYQAITSTQSTLGQMFENSFEFPCLITYTAGGILMTLLKTFKVVLVIGSRSVESPTSRKLNISGIRKCFKKSFLEICNFSHFSYYNESP